MKIAFVDMSFHIENTKSSQFFIDILSPLGEIHHISNIDAWKKVPAIKPDILIIWQLLPSPAEIDFWGVKNVILIPMYDACPHDLDFWNKYKKYKIFCFSKTLFFLLKENGFTCYHSQYYIKPNEISINKFNENLCNCFFWERYNKLTWATVKNVIKFLPLKHVHFHTGLTQSQDERPTQEEVDKYSITFSTWFEHKSDLDKILDNTGIYISPRVEEGIGLSFIEALSRGNLVAAFDAPTMNEYITDGVDGILFTHDKFPKEQYTPEQINSIQNKSVKRAKEGYEKWISSEPAIRDFISSPVENYKSARTFKGYCIYLIHILKSTAKKILRRN